MTNIHALKEAGLYKKLIDHLSSWFVLYQDSSHYHKTWLFHLVYTYCLPLLNCNMDTLFPKE